MDAGARRAEGCEQQKPPSEVAVDKWWEGRTCAKETETKNAESTHTREQGVLNTALCGVYWYLPPLLSTTCHLCCACVWLLVHREGSCCNTRNTHGGLAGLFSCSKVGGRFLSLAVLGRLTRQRRSTSSTSHQARIAPSLYHELLRHGKEVGDDGPPADRISVGELTVPDAKKSLPTATVTVAAQGFIPVTGVPLDLLGRGTHVYRMTRKDVRRGVGLSRGGDRGARCRGRTSELGIYRPSNFQLVALCGALAAAPVGTLRR